MDVTATGCRILQPVVERCYRSIETIEDLSEALSLHQTADDSPANTNWAFADLVNVLQAGRSLYQFVLTVPDHDAEKEHGPSIVREPVAEGTLLLGPWSLASLLCIGRRMAFHAVDHGLVDTIESRWRGPVYRYAIVNERMEEWVRRFQHWAPLDHICAGWLNQERVAEGAWTRRQEGRTFVYLDFKYVRWAAGQRSADQLRRITQAQVTE